MSPAIAVTIREKRFAALAGQPPHIAIRDLSFSAAPGAFVALTGPSGCGKTTLLNIVAGLDTAFDGTVTFGTVGAAPPRIGYVFQTPRLLPWRTVLQNLVLAAPSRELQALVDLIDEMGLAGFHDYYPERLSIGMQRRVALARAFAIEPDILLMDEPFVSLDDDTANRLRALLQHVLARRPTTVLFVTHDRDEAVRLATRVLVLSAAPARILADVPVSLAPAERADSAAVKAQRDVIAGMAANTGVVLDAMLTPVDIGPRRR